MNVRALGVVGEEEWVSMVAYVSIILTPAWTYKLHLGLCLWMESSDTLLERGPSEDSRGAATWLPRNVSPSLILMPALWAVHRRMV